jgi:arginine-tRNA-protein transferase
VARQLQHLVEPPRPCSYLGEATARLEIRVMLDVTPNELDALLERGWRRFGPCYFRPACSPCNECVTLRVPVATFRPSKGQRRAAKACAHLRRVVGRPLVDAARLSLYEKWHATRERMRGWGPNALDPERYALDFAFPHACVREVAFYDAERLVGVGIVDETPRALSAVYFYYDPEYGCLSPGTANVLYLIEDAKQRSLAHVYLGYRVKGCASLRYKETFVPHELLEGRPKFDERPVWRLADAPARAKSPGTA